MRRDADGGLRILVALVLACFVGIGLNKAVAPLHSAVLDSFAFFVTIGIALFLGDATR